jgi:hypothetical protein
MVALGGERQEEEFTQNEVSGYNCLLLTAYLLSPCNLCYFVIHKQWERMNSLLESLRAGLGVVAHTYNPSTQEAGGS